MLQDRPGSHDNRASVTPADALAIFEFTPDPYLILRPDFTIVAVNNAYLKATSTVREEIVGRNIFDVFPDNPKDPNATGVKNLMASLEKVLQTSQPNEMPVQKYDIPIHGKPGSEFEEHYWKPLNVPVPGEKGKVTFIIHHVKDVTETVKAKLYTEELEESEMLFRQIANAMPQIVWSTYADGYHDYFNNRFYEYTGVERGTTYGEKWEKLIHPDDRERLWNTWAHSIKTGEPYEIEYRILHHSGEYRWNLVRALAFRNPAGNITRWFGTSTDIHDKRRAEAALKDAIKEREMFFSIASHELKTPLTTLSLHAQVQVEKLKKVDAGNISLDSLRSTMKIIDRQVQNLIRLVDEMLDLSRIRSGKLSLELKSFNLGELLKDVLSRIANQFREAGTSQPILEECADAWGKWDPTRIEQVLTNLLTNALRYGRGKPISIRLVTFDSSVRLSVKDEGIGIPSHALKTIFEPFERVTSTSQTKGLGLGLYITKQIVQQHGGKIWAESEMGKGSTFFVEMPRLPVTAHEKS